MAHDCGNSGMMQHIPVANPQRFHYLGTIKSSFDSNSDASSGWFLRNATSPVLRCNNTGIRFPSLGSGHPFAADLTARRYFSSQNLHLFPPSC